VTVIPLQLGPRPDEPGPPISQGPQSYSHEVTARLTDDAAVIVAKYPEARSALLPLLHLVQAEDGYLTPAGIAFCAERLALSPAEVTAVATFYSMYRRTPTGDYLVGVCTNTLCAVMGGASDNCAAQKAIPAGVRYPSSACTRCSSGSSDDRGWGYRAMMAAASALSRSVTSAA